MAVRADQENTGISVILKNNLHVRFHEYIKNETQESKISMYLVNNTTARLPETHAKLGTSRGQEVIDLVR